MRKKGKGLKKGDSNKSKSPVVFNRSSISISSGPLPDPEIMERYEQILPGAAEKIMSMAEKQVEHRHTTEKEIIKEQFQEARIGQYCALTLGTVAIFSGSLVAVYGNSIAGGLIGCSGSIGLVTAFLRNNKKDQNNTSQNDKQ